MRVPRLLLIADHGASGGDDPWLRLVADLVALDLPAASAVQLRVKDTAAHERRVLLRDALALPRRLPVLVNGTTAEADDLGADGVHWPESAIPASAGDDAATPGLLRGASVHSAAAVDRAVAAGAGYVVFAPVFAPRSKPGAGRGLGALRRIAGAAPVPVLALGGIDVDRVAACIGAGAAGVAVVGALASAPSPVRAARDLARAVAAGTRQDA